MRVNHTQKERTPDIWHFRAICRAFSFEDFADLSNPQITLSNPQITLSNPQITRITRTNFFKAPRSKRLNVVHHTRFQIETLNPQRFQRDARPRSAVHLA
jgi:hypothetical protein